MASARHPAARVASMSLAAVIVCAYLKEAAAQSWPLPLQWPSQHVHNEIMYVPDLGTVHG
jgi:hypothetical protein